MYKLSLLTLVILLIALTANSQPPFKVGIAVDEPAISGNCHPTRVHFTGRINATAPGEVQYQWVRSDHADVPVRTLRFTRPGPVPVSFDWSLSRSANGWVALKILYPNRIESRHAQFSVACP
jgi:hypothetical protein